ESLGQLLVIGRVVREVTVLIPARDAGVAKQPGRCRRAHAVAARYTRDPIDGDRPPRRVVAERARHDWILSLKCKIQNAKCRQRSASCLAFGAFCFGCLTFFRLTLFRLKAEATGFWISGRCVSNEI